MPDVELKPQVYKDPRPKEYFDQFSEPDGSTWFMVTTIVEDPVYLAVPFVTTSHFRKERDASGWRPEPCSAR